MSRRVEVAVVSAGAILFATVFSFPLLKEIGLTYNLYDWDLLRGLDWIAVYIIQKFHQFPLWSPYQCGGLQLLANPEARILTPFFPLHLIFGSTVGINLEIPIHLAIAWSGGYVLGRVLNFRPLGAIGCAMVFPSSSWFYLRLCAGGLHFLAFAFSPWIVAFTLLAIDRRRAGWAVAVGALIALAFHDGGVYPVTDTGLLISLLAVYFALQRRSVWPLLVVLIAAVFAGGFAAPKVLPMLAAGQSRATSADEEWMWLSEYVALLFSRTQDCYRWSVWCGVGSMPFCMIAAYLSPAFVSLGLLGIYGFPRRAVPWVLLIVIFTILALGNYFGPYSPWVLLHMLPVFSWVRVVPRFLMMVVFCFSILTGYGLEMLSGRRPVWIAVGILLLAAGTIDGYLIGPPNLVHHTDPPPPLPYSTVFRQYQDENDVQTVRVNEANMGATRCVVQMAAMGIVSPSNRPGYKGEQYLLGPGWLKLARWTPEILNYEVDVKAPTVLVVNQNYDASWKPSRGRGEVFSYNGLLAVRLPPGAQRLELRYRSSPFVVGLVISLAALAIALFVAWYESRILRRESGG